MAVVDLGKLRFDWKGDFDPSKAYEARDVVRYQGDIYIFTRDHAANSWNPSDADVMLVSADVVQNEGDLITGSDSGLSSRLPIGYDHTAEWGGQKNLQSVSTVPTPVSINKAVTFSNNQFYVDGASSPVVDVYRKDTLVFDLSSSTLTGHAFELSSIDKGIHGGNPNTHVSTVSDGTTTFLQVSSPVTMLTPGGVSVNALRTLYTYYPDSTTAPSYGGAEYPHIFVQGTLTFDSTVAASLTTTTVDGREVLCVNGRPAYTFAAESGHKTAGGHADANWAAFTAGGATTKASMGAVGDPSFVFNTGVTRTGTQGASGAVIQMVTSPATVRVYYFDNTLVDTAGGNHIEPTSHQETAALSWETPRVVQTTYCTLNRIAYFNGNAALPTLTWCDLNSTYENNATWETTARFRPSIKVKQSGTVLRHALNIHMGWNYGSFHQFGRILRSEDNGGTWTRPSTLVSIYTSGSQSADFGAYVYSTNAGTYSYQGEQLSFSFIDKDAVQGKTYIYKIQALTTSACPISFNWQFQVNGNNYSRIGTSHWMIDEIVADNIEIGV
jgi:hypothetical protein